MVTNNVTKWFPIVKGIYAAPPSLTIDKCARNSTVAYRGEHAAVDGPAAGNTGCTDSQNVGPGAMHGWGIALRIQQVSREILQVGQGSLLSPASSGVKGVDQSEWGTSENNRRAKFYLLTSAGRKQLMTELETWDRLSGAIALVLGQAPEASS